jgi:CheY-like chemotaxis protein
MNGRIWVDSTPGMGSTFHFTARFGPAPAEAKPAAREGSTETIRSGVARALRVLVVEDSPENRFLVSEYLKELGHRLDFAEDGQIGVEKFRAGAYDLVLMDPQMPVLDGYEATRRIRAWEREQRRAPTPIVALTASALEAEVKEALNAGCNSCIRKPVRLTTLLEIVGSYAAPAERIQVRTDARLRAVIPGYLDNRRADVRAIAAALERSEFESIRDAGHKMSGTGLGYGFARISEIGSAIEKAAEERNATGIRTLVAELATYVEQVEVVS